MGLDVSGGGEANSFVWATCVGGSSKNEFKMHGVMIQTQKTKRDECKIVLIVCMSADVVILKLGFLFQITFGFSNSILTLLGLCSRLLCTMLNYIDHIVLVEVLPSSVDYNIWWQSRWAVTLFLRGKAIPR